MSEVDHVRESTSETINERIDREMEERVRRLVDAGDAAITARIEELEREWDVERKLEANAATLALTGALLAAVHDRRWAILPAVVGGFLLQHAIQGWCPPIEIFRRIGTRTRKEIERERFALKAVRGDFDRISGGGDAARALEAVDR